MPQLLSPLAPHPAVTLAMADPLGRCEHVRVDTQMCQLLAAHDGPHAQAVSDAYLTWNNAATSGWSIQTPPGWLIDLAWAPGFQPITHQEA